MTKTRLRGSPCSGLRGSQKGSTVPCCGSMSATSAFCLKVIFTACCRRHAFFFIRLFHPDPRLLSNVFCFILSGTITLSLCPDHWRILKLFHRISRCPILSAENIFCPDGLWSIIERDLTYRLSLLALCLGLTTGCSSSKTDAAAASKEETTAAASAESAAETTASAETKSIDSLKIAFSPYADADTITTATEPLENLLKGHWQKKATMSKTST